MKTYLRVISILYLIGFLLHVADVASLRLDFSGMNTTWKVWIVYLLIMDLIAAIGLWNQKTFGIVFFLIVAGTQLVAYTVFRSFFGEQTELIVFHIITLAGFFGLVVKKRFGTAYTN
jgi:hypothetical protein